MNITQGQLDVGKSNLDKITVAMDRCMNDRNDIAKKRMWMIDSFSRRQIKTTSELCVKGRWVNEQNCIVYH